MNTDERLVLEGNTQLDPDDVEDAARTVAGGVAHADKPTPEEIDVCRELLEALGLRPASPA